MTIFKLFADQSEVSGLLTGYIRNYVTQFSFFVLEVELCQISQVLKMPMVPKEDL